MSASHPGGPTREERQLHRAARLIVRTQTGSAGLLQRQMGVTLPRATALMDLLEANGVVGPAKVGRVRDVLVRADQLDDAFYASLSVTAVSG